MNKIIYTDEVVKSVELLAQELSEASVIDGIEGKIAYYLNYVPHLERLSAIIPFIVPNAETILEIGSGIGTNCLLLKALTNKNLIGVEPAPDSYSPLQNCIRAFKDANNHLPYLYMNCGGEAIEYGSESCDFIYSFEVLEHVKNPLQVLKEIYRLLKPGANAYISTCNYDSFYEGHYRSLWNPFVSPERNGKRFEKRGMSIAFLKELNYITKKEIKAYCTEIGFQRVEFNPSYQEGGENYKYNIEAEYPSEFVMPTGIQTKPVWLHKMIERPIVAGILEKFDREYKIYLLLTK